MLTRLAIENFATIESLDLQFGPGMTVLTGETGAGKSIMFDALDLLFGSRADSAVVRAGGGRCQLVAEVKLEQQPEILHWLQDNELIDVDVPEQLLLRRVIREDGGSKAWINGQPCTLAMLRSLAEGVLDIHGQHAHQALLRPTEQRRIIDDFGALKRERDATAEAYRLWRTAERELAALQSSEVNDPALRELLEYQSAELNEFAPEKNEFAQLNEEFIKLNRVDELRAEAATLEHLLTAEGGVEDQLSSALRRCEGLSSSDAGLLNATNTLAQALEAVRDARHDIQHQADSFESDPERLAVISARLDQWEALARKHKCPADELPELCEQLNQRLLGAQGDDQQRQQLAEQIVELRSCYQSAAQALSVARKRASERLAEAVRNDLPALGLPHAQIEFAVLTDPETAGRDGQDSVQIRISMNPGQKLQPLVKAASGGELARISLAIGVNAQTNRRVPILLFDEVDVGVGGAIASAIGEHLQALAANNQLLVVTHQPQVAGLGDAHFRVSKEVRDGQTYSCITALNRAERIDELSRMAGGREITAQTRAHAEALLKA